MSLPALPTVLTVAVLLTTHLMLVRRLRAQNRQLRAQLRQQRDPVTGVLLRQSWTVAAEESLPTLHQPAVAFVDVNQLKPLNDRHGHAYGDQLLREIADHLSAQFGPQALIGRFGGDEFVVLLDLPASWHEHVWQATEACTVTIKGIRCGAAFGLARPVDVARRDVTAKEHLPDATQAVRGQLDRLLHAADLALLRAKRRCHAEGLSTALEIYGPQDPAVPMQLEINPDDRVRHSDPAA